MVYDLLVKGGLVVDPSQNIEDIRDVAVSGNHIAEVAADIKPASSKTVIDASGKIVTPGIVDLHTHVFWGISHYGVDVEETCLAKGVTTVVDAGTSGALNFEGFRKFIIEPSKCRVIPYLHIGAIGLTTHRDVGELLDLRYLDFEKAVKTGKEHSDMIKGIKIRLGEGIVGKHGPQALRLAKEAAVDLGVPLMVHPGALPVNLPLADVLSVLEEGDILTHCLPPSYPPSIMRPTILDENNKVIPEYMDALRRGVIMDVGHGAGSFSFETARIALSEGIIPIISTDIHIYSLKFPVFDMPTTLSKFMAMGLSLSKVIECSTSMPARVLGLEGQIGTLGVSAEADIAVFEMKDGDFTFMDVRSKTINGEKMLKATDVIKSGEIVFPRNSPSQ